MKDRKRLGVRLLPAVLAVALLAGCGGSEEIYGEDDYSRKNVAVNYGDGAFEDVEDLVTSEVQAGGWSEGYDSYEEWGENNNRYQADATLSQKSPAVDSDQVSSGRKLIKNVNLSVETREFDVMMPALEARVRELGGYIEDLETYNGSRYSGNKNIRYANLTVRIPQSRLDDFVGSVSEIGNVVRRTDSVNDVTKTYVDTESRRNALKTEYDRLLELMERAETLEEILILEDRLTTLRYQLESMESQLRTMDNQVDYSTVRLSVSEVEELAPAVDEPEEEKSIWQRISSGFSESLREVRENAADAVVDFLSSVPYLLTWAIPLLIVILVAVGIFRGRRKKKKKLTGDGTDSEKGC